MFNFFFRQKDKPSDSEMLAGITYYITKDDDIKIDILIEDYSDATIKAMSSLLNTIGHDICFLETVEFLRKSMSSEEETQVLIKILLNITDTLNHKLASMPNSKTQPCIKPSDLYI